MKTAEVTVAKVTFSAAQSQRYGYDDFDTPAVLTDDHICVKQSDYTFLHVKIEGGAVGTDFNFAGTDAALITPATPDGIAEFDLRLDAAAENKKETDLHARCQCPAATSFALIKAHVYKEKVVDIVVSMTLGGPGRATELYGFYVFRTARRFFNYGAAAAQGFRLLMIVMVLFSLLWGRIKNLYDTDLDAE